MSLFLFFVFFSSFLFLFLFLSFVFSFLSLSSFSVCWWCVCRRVCSRVCLCGVVWCGVVWCGACRVVWHAENPVCGLKKTPPCVDSKRPRVCRQHAHMLFNTCARCRHTRGRFEWTHGGQGDVIVSSVPKFAHVGSSLGPRGQKPMHLTHFQLENRSRTTRSRFLKSFALPDEAVQLQLT